MDEAIHGLDPTPLPSFHIAFNFSKNQLQCQLQLAGSRAVVILLYTPLVSDVEAGLFSWCGSAR